jgi:polysaccharide biosynthesis protein VpsQ
MKWLAILFTFLLLLIIVLADMGALPRYLQLLKDLPYGDKVGHFILYGILTLLVDLALFGSRPNRSRKLLVLTSGMILALLIGLEEFSQRYFANRTFSLKDLAASYLGVIFFSWLALRVQRIWSNR